MRLNSDRLNVVKQMAVLDTAPEAVYDDLTRTAASTFGVPIAMVNILDADRDFFKSCVGFPSRESPVFTSFCEVIFHSKVSTIVCEDTALDPYFAKHPFVLSAPFVRFYAAARLTVGGQTVGTLCVYDFQPKVVLIEQLQTLQTLANAAMVLLDKRGH